MVIDSKQNHTEIIFMVEEEVETQKEEPPKPEDNSNYDSTYVQNIEHDANGQYMN